MLIAAFRLNRDRHTEKDAFGFTRTVTGWTEQYRTHLPILGCPIETPITLKTKLVKLIEFYNRSLGRIVVERICWMFGTSLYPYKVRFIHLDSPHHANDVDILLLQNMTIIHRNLTHNNVQFSSPVQYLFDTASAPWHNNHQHEFLAYLNSKYRYWVDYFAHGHDRWKDTERFVDSFDSASVQDNLENYFKEFILPRVPILDPLTLNYHTKPLDTRNLVFEKSAIVPFDVTEPIELTINHPIKTLYSPKINPNAINIFDQLTAQYSDLSFEYILSGMAIIDIKENYKISRYKEMLYIDAEKDVTWLIINVVFDIILHHFNDRRLFSDVRVCFILTYGEEALIEFYTYETNDCIGAVHIDLAMLALCGTNIAAASDII